ncbi:DUF58 domain-containing protein [Planctomyces sp. SH-PL62]|uniref:DUF58 domain-containing protein n=1 Tax=Planctomyces sp. SH-PL62 TaxID=1636152 RepID=UPI00078DD658|nr:DUF58 domain-containing protein [Planctomyces sp. SH-PL62]AMV38084.1 hypothetical protein VT85_11645 [Planctomyces sp. SH-PL62]
MPADSGSTSTARTPLLDPEFLHKLEQLELVSRKIIVGRLKGERKSRRKGTSVEFAEHRQYAPGDDLRHIDWNAFGRLDRLFLKLFLEEEDLHVHTLVDSSLSMGFGEPTKLHYAKQVAAALAFIGLVNNDRIILETFASRLQAGVPNVRGRSQMWRIVQYLERLEPSGESDLTAAARDFAIKQGGKGVVVVISDFLDKRGYEDALRYLLARRMDVFVIHVLSREEVEPELVGDLRLVDCEDDEEADVTISAPLLKRYKENLDAFVGGLRDYCTKRGITYVFTTNQYPFEKLVLNYLRERGLLK